jgi:polysaccharide export outer membrane protein
MSAMVLKSRTSLFMNALPGLFLIGICVFGAGLQAQVPASPATQTTAAPADSVPTLQPSPTIQLRSLEPAEDEEYTLGGGDELTVSVAGHPELSGKQMVGPDGRVTLPTAGTVNLNGLTREQADAALVKALSVYYRDPAVTISIDKYGSNRVMVTGAVQKQGYVYFQQTPTLLDAITQAGLLQSTGPAGAASNSGTTAKQSAAMMPQECKVYEGTGDDQKVVTVNIGKLMNSANGLANLRLRRNAVVYVENPRDRFVSVLGEVMRPGPVVLSDELNLAEIIGLAGGLTEKSGGNPNIAVVDPTTRKIRYIRYKDAISPNGMNEVALLPGELIVVPKAGLAKAGYVFQQLGPITGLASIFAIAAF